MAKIKCPHCGATNQDVTENDPCWQCGKTLGAPAVEPQTPESAVTTDATPTASVPQAAPPTPTPAPMAQQQVERPASTTTPAPPGTSFRRSWMIALGVFIVGLIVVIVIVLLTKHGR